MKKISVTKIFLGSAIILSGLCLISAAFWANPFSTNSLVENYNSRYEQQKEAQAITCPCDIFASGDTPCVAAHSTVRALFGSYNGNLYQVRRESDGATRDIPVLTTGGFADSAVQDQFCSGTTCTISIIYDQSGMGNHLTVAPAGGAGEADVEAIATSERLIVGGHPVYSVYTSAGMGYRNNNTSGVATGDDPESIYMVTSGIHYN
jgi:hypothetical protein